MPEFARVGGDLYVPTDDEPCSMGSSHYHSFEVANPQVRVRPSRPLVGYLNRLLTGLDETTFEEQCTIDSDGCMTFAPWEVANRTNLLYPHGDIDTSLGSITSGHFDFFVVGSRDHITFTPFQPREHRRFRAVRNEWRIGSIYHDGQRLTRNTHVRDIFPGSRYLELHYVSTPDAPSLIQFPDDMSVVDESLEQRSREASDALCGRLAESFEGVEALRGFSPLTLSVLTAFTGYEAEDEPLTGEDLAEDVERELHGPQCPCLVESDPTIVDEELWRLAQAGFLIPGDDGYFLNEARLRE